MPKHEMKPMLRKLEHRLFSLFFLMGLLLPLGLLVMLSLGRRWIFPELFPQEWTLTHWGSLLRGSSGLRSGLLLSLGISLVVAALATGFGFWAARQVARSRRRGLALWAAYAPYVLSPVIYALLLQVFFLRLGLSGHVAGVVLGQLLLTFPFAVIFFQSFWGRQTLDYEQAARTLGASGGQIARRVLLPLARPLLVLCFFQCFLISWFEFGLTNLIGLGQVKTLPVQVFQYVQEANVHYAALASLLLIGPPLVLLLLNRRFLRGGLLAVHPPEEQI